MYIHKFRKSTRNSHTRAKIDINRVYDELQNCYITNFVRLMTNELAC